MRLSSEDNDIDVRGAVEELAKGAQVGIDLGVAEDADAHIHFVAADPTRPRYNVSDVKRGGAALAARFNNRKIAYVIDFDVAIRLKSGFSPR